MSSRRKKRRGKKKSFKPMPPRTEIREALAEVSDFTPEEIGILYYSSMYKAYSLIVRYGKKGVEEEFRREKWFREALKTKK